MRPSRETKEEKFRRLAEARVNKILHLLRLLGNLSWTGTYAYTREQVEQIFTALQSEQIKAKLRFLQEQESSKKRFSLSKPYDTEEPKPKNTPMLAIPLPDGTYLRAVGYPDLIIPASISTGITASMNQQSLCALWSSILTSTGIRGSVSEPTGPKRKTQFTMDRTLR